MLRKTGPDCGGVRLYILSLDSTRTVCQVWPGPFASESQQRDVYEEIEERALRQANVLGGSHAFLVEVFDGAKAVLSTEFFRVSAEGLPNGALMSEPANEAGKFAQMMRHTERMFQTSLDAIRVAQHIQKDTLQDQRERVRALESERVELLTVARDAVMQQREHDLNVIKAKAKADMMTSVARQVENLLPEVASVFANKMTKAPAAAAAIGMKGLISTLRPEQIGKILEALDPEQQVTMVGAMKHLAEAAEQEKGAVHGATTAIAKH